MSIIRFFGFQCQIDIENQGHGHHFKNGSHYKEFLF